MAKAPTTPRAPTEFLKAPLGIGVTVVVDFGAEEEEDLGGRAELVTVVGTHEVHTVVVVVDGTGVEHKVVEVDGTQEVHEIVVVVTVWFDQVVVTVLALLEYLGSNLLTIILILLQFGAGLVLFPTAVPTIRGYFRENPPTSKTFIHAQYPLSMSSPPIPILDGVG